MRDTTINNKKKLLECLERHKGIITHACKEAGISRETCHFWIRTDPDFKRDFEAINETVIDFVENKLFKKIEDGSEKSIHFYLRFKAKGRGYTDSLDITSKGESISEVEVRIIRDDFNIDNDTDE